MIPRRPCGHGYALLLGVCDSPLAALTCAPRPASAVGSHCTLSLHKLETPLPSKPRFLHLRSVFVHETLVLSAAQAGHKPERGKPPHLVGAVAGLCSPGRAGSRQIGAQALVKPNHGEQRACGNEAEFPSTFLPARL